jgi:hypothetical protein
MVWHCNCFVICMVWHSNCFSSSLRSINSPTLPLSTLLFYYAWSWKFEHNVDIWIKFRTTVVSDIRHKVQIRNFQRELILASTQHSEQETISPCGIDDNQQDHVKLHVMKEMLNRIYGFDWQLCFWLRVMRTLNGCVERWHHGSNLNHATLLNGYL